MPDLCPNCMVPMTTGQYEWLQHCNLCGFTKADVPPIIIYVTDDNCSNGEVE